MQHLRLITGENLGQKLEVWAAVIALSKICNVCRKITTFFPNHLFDKRRHCRRSFFQITLTLCCALFKKRTAYAMYKLGFLKKL